MNRGLAEHAEMQAELIETGNELMNDDGRQPNLREWSNELWASYVYW